MPLLMNFARLLIVAGTVFLASSFTWLLAAPAHLGSPFLPDGALEMPATVALWTPPTSDHGTPGSTTTATTPLGLGSESDRQQVLAMLLASYLRHAIGNEGAR